MAYDNKTLEESIKLKLSRDYFKDYDTTDILGRIDYAVAIIKDKADRFETEYLLWAESKKGNRADLYESFVQLILTIGKERHHEKTLPPAYLGAFDAEKIAFIPFSAIHDVLSQNDFNWNVTPSDHSTKEFKQLMELVRGTLEENLLLFKFDTDSKLLKRFIRSNFKPGVNRSRIRITRNNFIHIYQRWVKLVKPSIRVPWDKAKEKGISDADFYLADILSEKNNTLKEKLYVLLRDDHYVLGRNLDDSGLYAVLEATFADGQKAHRQFWNHYSRPPKEEYWDYMVERRDLLINQDIREYKGAYFTPSQWVELSQQYIAAELGEDWQDEYYVWDCAAGTGNLLVGLQNKYNVWASTLDQADVDVMKTRIKDGMNLLEKHVFQFDFLNDSFDKLPEGLREIINDEEKRKKLVIYINPPYAEAASRSTISGKGQNKIDVAVKTKVYQKYADKIDIAARELFAQFLIRIYCEIPSALLAQFSTLKIEQAPSFRDFREIFRAKLGRNFVVPSKTFDNINGDFPIGFFFWRLDGNEVFSETQTDVYDKDGNFLGKRTLAIERDFSSINDWIITTRKREGEKPIGFMSAKGCDFQNANGNFIINSKEQLPHPRGTMVTDKNLLEICVYYAVRHCIEPTWINDRDQFRYPDVTWKDDKEFHSDCIAYTLFSNNIQSKYGANHWIPFTEYEVNAKDRFKSRFMSDFLKGKIKLQENNGGLFGEEECFIPKEPVVFSDEAQEVMDTGRELWKYYHAQPGANPDASLYDIKGRFQGFKTGKDGKQKMNSDSPDETYMRLIKDLRTKLKALAEKIEPKVYEHGFLKN